jgi:rhamnose utilization protein RhaD (predicted bifunctional aldolase and dehydrogenase)
MMTYKLELTTQEAQVVYEALSTIGWGDKEVVAEYEVRRKLEKISIKQYGSSLHDHLVEQGVVPENIEKPDLRTINEKIADFKESLQ